MTIPQSTQVVHLRCVVCTRPFMKLQGGVIVVESQHRGEHHINVVALADLVALAYGSTSAANNLAGEQCGPIPATEAAMPPLAGIPMPRDVNAAHDARECS